MKLTFKEIVNREITKEYEDWKGEYIEIRKYKDGSIDIEDEIPCCVTGVSSNELFTLARREGCLNEALQFLEKGIEIESAVSGRSFKLEDCDCEKAKKIPMFTIEEAKGKWYIND